MNLPPGTTDALAAAVDSRMEHYTGVLASLVSVPGIAWAGFDQAELECSAVLVQELVRGVGFPDAKVVRSAAGPDVWNAAGGAPGVLATRPAAPGVPTILLYAHHDVQPAGPLDEWSSTPFAAERRDGRLWGRGAADNKAGIVMHLAAVEALDAVLGPGNGLGVRVFIEGEEESGSPTLPAFLQEFRPDLLADVAIVADSGSWAVGTPALTTSLRGLVDGTIHVRILDHALHSGTYGGPLLDALVVLARLMGTFHDDDGTVAVEGLAQGPTPAVEMDEDTFRRDAGVLDGVHLVGEGSLTARLWNKPSLSFIGLDAPPTASAGNVLLPEATVKFSLRLPPGNDPDRAMDVLQRHVLKHAPFGAEVSFSPGSRSKPFNVGLDNPMIRSALWSLETAWGAEPVAMGVGGSIPFVAALAEAQPACSILVTGAEDPDSRAHGANESVHLGELRNAIVAEALFLAEMAGR
ncbi:M20/M25/M40 family metallo-hydrolase [Paenarthrobacter sp. NPDC058040]|uniref:M20/M25/M40 family metallo-hydrolase n=1 Tax=unclassified Paenarthrobacter TaxID=2634190 RepID=UPI0036DE9B3A